ncbi:F-BAR domain only protein 1 isoform X2 [Hyla sarda]|uniref:F-BAR domain only protein 1 isoform X2 n=1 Tax=Hyla sarda TaxID=327740 RepID=UPI0024C2643C|nr:F-BAR domain only protein 1 isoform X2 [Hyla sarda]XP_056374064.1 F-BAR domain only protein 1 isoform X2 [Hyla sarda]
MSYFGDHFWGDKNSGFAVLYHNMKHGQLSIKELAEFVRERAAVEEAYSKSMQKLSKMVTSGSHLGTFAPMWEMFRVSSDKLALCHLELSKKLHDLIKDINKYGDEQIKVHKKAKEEMSGTLEVIQLLQCSSQLLQKTRDNYCSRFAEQERLRREGALQKEMDKAEQKTQKAAESLRGSVEKYNTVRKEFEEKMLQSAQLFQDTEAAHLTQMKRLVSAYSHSVEDTHVQIGQVQEEFKHNMENVAIDKLIRKFAESNGTGTERPEAVEFEGFRFPTSLEGVKRTWSKPFRIRGLSRREKDTHHVEHTDPDCVDLPDVDEEGFTRRPDDTVTRESSVACCSSSDSDFDDDDDEPRRFRIQIKPAQTVEGEEDEETKMKRLRETVGCMIQPPAAVVSVRRQTVRTVTNTGDASAKTLMNCHTDKPSLGFSNTSPSSVTNSCDANSICNSHPAHSSFGPQQESVSESDDFTVCRTYTLASSPSPFSSSSPENVEDSGLDSPFHPFSGPSPDSRPWTPREDSSIGDSVLVTSSFTDSPADLTTSNSTGKQRSERDTWEHKITAPSPPLPSCTTTGTTQLFSTNHDFWGITSGIHNNLCFSTESSYATFRTQRNNNLTASINQSLLIPGAPSSTTSDRGFISPPTLSAGLSVGLSRGPSPVILGSQESLPVAAAFTEYVHAVFEEGVLEGSGVRVSGELTMSFPWGILRVFGGSTPPPVLSFRLIHTSEVEHFIPNPDLLYSDLSQSDPNCKDFWLNMQRLTCHLQNMAEQQTAPYYNVVLLKYQVFKAGISAAPLQLSSSWNCTPTSTEISLEYKHNLSLCDMHILLPLDEPLSNLQFDPPARCSERRLLWQIPNTSPGKEGYGKLYARWHPLGNCSTPSPAAAQFTCEGRTLSGVDIELVGSGYRMSLVKKRFAAGKYLVC